MLIVALDEPAAGRVIFRDSQQQRAVAGEREGRLHQTLAKSRLAEDPGAIVILQRASQNLSGRSGAPVYQNNYWIFLATLAALGDELGFGRRPAVMGDDELAFVQEPVCH